MFLFSRKKRIPSISPRPRLRAEPISMMLASSSIPETFEQYRYRDHCRQTETVVTDPGPRYRLGFDRHGVVDFAGNTVSICATTRCFDHRCAREYPQGVTRLVG